MSSYTIYVLEAHEHPPKGVERPTILDHRSILVGDTQMRKARNLKKMFFWNNAFLSISIRKAVPGEKVQPVNPTRRKIIDRAIAANKREVTFNELTPGEPWYGIEHAMKKVNAKYAREEEERLQRLISSLEKSIEVRMADSSTSSRAARKKSSVPSAGLLSLILSKTSNASRQFNSSLKRASARI